jgi:hypothetical protein
VDIKPLKHFIANLKLEIFEFINRRGNMEKKTAASNKGETQLNIN